jgi:hypothetical protein
MGVTERIVPAASTQSQARCTPPIARTRCARVSCSASYPLRVRLFAQLRHLAQRRTPGQPRPVLSITKDSPGIRENLPRSSAFFHLAPYLLISL